MYNFKVVFWGDSKVGKTSMMRGLNSQPYRPHHPPTLGGTREDLSFQSNQVSNTVQYQLSEVAGKKENSDNAWLKNQDLGVYCFNASQPIDEAMINDEIALFKSLNPKASVIVVGTQLDQRGNNPEVARQLQRLTEALYPIDVINTSALRGEGLARLKDCIELEIESQIEQLDLLSLLKGMNPKSKFYKALLKFHDEVYSQVSASKQKAICLEMMDLLGWFTSSLSFFHEKRSSIVKFVTNCKAHLGTIEEKKAYIDAIGIGIGLPIVFSILVGVIVAFTAGLAAVPLSVLIIVGLMQVVAGLVLWGTLASNHGAKELDSLESELIEDLINIDIEEQVSSDISLYFKYFADFKEHELEKKNKSPETSKSFQLAKDLYERTELPNISPCEMVTPEMKQRMDQCRFFKPGSTARLLVDNLAIYDHPKIFMG
ncbi:MAG: GTPase domain-containing protein [Tatlockia sp.]|nr:GTPase domain-containing protein [Tatlockia sp.]